MKLHDLTATFNEEGIEIKGYNFEVRETDKCYISKNNSRVDKEKVMKITNKWYQNRYDRIEFSTYCLDEQLEDAKKQLVTKVLDTFAARFDAMDKMMDHYNLLRNPASHPHPNDPQPHSMNIV